MDCTQQDLTTLTLNDEEIYKLFNEKCPKCKRKADTIHEIRPRSRGRSSMLLYNRTAICHTCHSEYHKHGASKSLVEEWQSIRDDYLTKLGKSWTFKVDGRPCQ